MMRRGWSLVEMLVVIAGLALLLPLLGRLTVQLLTMHAQLQNDELDPALLHAACLQLRCDAVAGAAALDTSLLQAGEQRWECAGGWLRRNGANRYPIEKWDVQEKEGWLLLRLQTAGRELPILLRKVAP